MPTNEPLLAVTMGDACGIGPEIVARALASGGHGPCVVVGDVEVMRRAARQCGLHVPVLVLNEPAEARDVTLVSQAGPPVHVADGMTDLRRLGVSLATVQTHARNIYGKLDVHNKAEALFEARQLGLLD